MNILGGCYSNTQRFCYSLGSVVFPPETGAIIPCLVCGALYSTRSLAKENYPLASGTGMLLLDWMVQGIGRFKILRLR